MRNIYIIGLLVFVMISCHEEVAKPIKVNKTKGVEVEIMHSAGDRWQRSDDYLPLPINVAEVEDVEFLVLSERIESGKKIHVNPVGALRLVKNDTLQTYVLSVPVERKSQSIRVKDFDEFTTIYSSAMWIIEQYMINRKPGNTIALKSWEDENYAIKYLLK